MGLSSSILKEQELSEFRKLNTDATNTDLELPAPPQNRRLTDKKGFVIFGILMLVLIPFLIYTLVKSDIRRINHGHDSCGNLCGIANKKIEGIPCSGKDFTKQPYVKIDIRTNERTCTEECPPGYSESDNNCYGGDDFQGNYTRTDVDLWRYSLQLWWKFVIIILITTILCTFALLLLRYFPGVIVWGVTIISIVLAIVLTIFFWYAFSRADPSDSNKQGYLALALITTLFTIVIVIIFLVLIKKIQLIIQLYKETAKALFAMPLLMLLPVITLILQFFVLALMVVTTTWMGTAAELNKVDNFGHYYYESNGVIKFTLVFNVIVTIWALQFLAGCQYMVIAGSVAQWFFKKDQVLSPIVISFTNTVRFHLGTIAFGAFIITLVAVIKAMIKSLISNDKLRWLVDCCCGNIEALLKFFSKNSYVQTAIHGQSFLRSGRRAATLLINNIGSVIAINSVGDFVLAMIQFFLLVISTAIAYAMFMNNEYYWLPTVFSFFINLIIVAMVFGVFETIVDTLFMCFCEDKSINDGENRPYYMSMGLMQFVEDSKKVYKEKK